MSVAEVFDLKTLPVISNGLNILDVVLFGSATGQSQASPDPISASALLGSNLSDIFAITRDRGDLIVGGASAWVDLALGTSGYHLQSNGTDPVWAGFLQSGTGAVTRTWQSKATDVFHIKDFGATFDGTTNDTAAWLAAIAALSANGGGRLMLPAGASKVLSTLTLPSNAQIVGEGENTTLNFTGQASGHGIVLGRFLCELRDFHLTSCHTSGIVASANAQSHLIENITVKFCGGDGITLSDTYGSTLRRIVSQSNTGIGFNIAGYSTSLTFEQCQSSGNSQGYYLNDVTYSSFTGCGSDQNLGYGYNLANIGGVTFNGCGAEINVSGSWVCSASTAIGAGKQISGVYGLVLSGCFTVGNGTGGGASSFLECVSLNSVPIQVTIDNCVDVASPNVISIIASGATSINRIGSLFAGAINLSGAATVNALLNTTPAADTLPYFDSVKTAATTSFPALGRAIAGLSTLTNHGILLGQAAAAPVATAAMTNGQLLVGQTGADPLPKTMSGDATLAASGALALISTITAGGPIGSATVTPIITYDANGRLITVSSATVTPAASSITGTLGADHGGTGLASYAIGDILYASATTTLAKLAGVATGNALISGGVTTAPSWGKIGLTTHISGTLPIANGGTNQTSLTTNSVLFYNGTSVQGTSAITWNGTILAVVGAGTNGFSMTGGHAANQGPYFFLADDTPQNIGIFGKEAAVLQGGSTASNFWVNAYVADLVFATNSTETFRIDRTSGLLKFVANSVNANGGTLMTLTSSSPGNASPQEWLKIKNTGGTTRYIPMY